MSRVPDTPDARHFVKCRVSDESDESSLKAPAWEQPSRSSASRPAIDAKQSVERCVPSRTQERGTSTLFGVAALLRTAAILGRRIGASAATCLCFLTALSAFGAARLDGGATGFILGAAVHRFRAAAKFGCSRAAGAVVVLATTCQVLRATVLSRSLVRKCAQTRQ